MDMLKKCLNPNVLISLAIVAVGVLVFAPHLALSVLPLLLLAACPLSMVLMVVMMGKGDKTKSEMSILKQRHASGNIDEETYVRMKANLGEDDK